MFGLLADLDQPHDAVAVDALDEVAVRSDVDDAGAVEAPAAVEAVAPAVVMLEAPRRSGGRCQRGSAEGGDRGEREHGFADHDVLLWFLDCVIRHSSRRAKPIGFMIQYVDRAE